MKYENRILVILGLLSMYGCTQAANFNSASAVPPAPTPTNTVTSEPSPVASSAPVSANFVSTNFGSVCPDGSSCGYTGAVEGTPTTMSCASGSLSVASTNYFTTTATESCLAYIKGLCNGKSSCTIDFTDTNCPGDPDVGVVKDGSVNVTCSDPVPSSQDAAAIQTLVTNQNSYRQVLGEDPLAPGLICYLYTVGTGTSSIASATPTYVTSFGTTGVFNQPLASVTSGFNILPAALASQYQTWFITKCEGSFVVAESGYYDFSLTADDGANLTIDGFLLNNDGVHSAETKTGTALLQEGVHGFELDYLQAAGNQELVLLMNGSVAPAYMFYH